MASSPASEEADALALTGAGSLTRSGRGSGASAFRAASGSIFCATELLEDGDFRSVSASRESRSSALPWREAGSDSLATRVAAFLEGSDWLSAVFFAGDSDSLGAADEVLLLRASLPMVLLFPEEEAWLLELLEAVPFSDFGPPPRLYNLPDAEESARAVWGEGSEGAERFSFSGAAALPTGPSDMPGSEIMGATGGGGSPKLVPGAASNDDPSIPPPGDGGISLAMAVEPGVP